MVLQKFVKFIPVVSKHKYWDEFIVLDENFIICWQKSDVEKNIVFTLRNTHACLVDFDKKINISESKYNENSQSEIQQKPLVATEKDKQHIQNSQQQKCDFLVKCVDECSTDNVPECHLNEFLVTQIHHTLQMDGQLFSYIVTELKRSQLFRKAVLDNLYAYYKHKKSHHQIFTQKCSSCECRFQILVVCISVIWPVHCIIDKKWDQKVKILVNERCELENAMSWLSTLGGAYSSLGDYFLHCAKKAEQISLKQYKLALKLGDPLMTARCKIYFAMSLVQQGYYKEAKRIIRKQYAFAITDIGRLDFRLANMCKAIWNKLKYIHFYDNLRNEDTWSSYSQKA